MIATLAPATLDLLDPTLVAIGIVIGSLSTFAFMKRAEKKTRQTQN